MRNLLVFSEPCHEFIAMHAAKMISREISKNVGKFLEKDTT